MKRIRIAMVAAFVFAIGSAFVTRASNEPKAIEFLQTGTACTATNLNCTLTGAHLCSVSNAYQSQSPSNPAVCVTILSKLP